MIEFDIDQEAGFHHVLKIVYHSHRATRHKLQIFEFHQSKIYAELLVNSLPQMNHCV